MKITYSEIRHVLKSRLSSQRRLFEFDTKQVIVLPFLEHVNIEMAIDEIRFFIDESGNFFTLKEINNISTRTDNAIDLNLSDGRIFNLYHRKMDGKYDIVRIPNFKIDKISIDHSPSIYIVLYLHYLKNSNTFNELIDFSKLLSKKAVTTQSIKEGGFKANAKKVLENMSPNQKESIIKSYADLFKDIKLEISIRENNSANLSLISLEYFKSNS